MLSNEHLRSIAKRLGQHGLHSPTSRKTSNLRQMRALVPLTLLVAEGKVRSRIALRRRLPVQTQLCYQGPSGVFWRCAAGRRRRFALANGALRICNRV